MLPTEGLWSSYLIIILLTVDHKCTIKPIQNSGNLNLTVRNKIQFCAGGKKGVQKKKMNVEELERQDLENQKSQQQMKHRKLYNLNYSSDSRCNL